MRLCDHLGFLPQLGCFADELPEALRARHRRLGVAPAAVSTRVALIGARRVRQGLGPFVARHLVAPAPRCRASRRRGPRPLAESERALGARGYADLAALLANEQLDALAILSPAETHERYLEARARGAASHVLCEKPLLWGGPGLARARRACSPSASPRAACCCARTASGRTRSPRSRAPSRRAAPPRRFAMRALARRARSRARCSATRSRIRSPCSRRSLPGDARASRRSRSPRGPGEVELRFAYRTATATTACEVRLRASRPAPARGRARRERRAGPSGRSGPETTRSPSGTARASAPVPDPLRDLLRDFVARCATRGAPADPAIPRADGAPGTNSRSSAGRGGALARRSRRR